MKKTSILVVILILVFFLASCDFNFINNTTQSTEGFEDKPEVNELEFTLNPDKKSYSVTGIGTCTDVDIVIPSVYNELPVTSIGGWAFVRRTAIESIVIPESVTSIGERAFQGCSSLIDVEISNSVTTIGGYAFVDCVSLTNINIPRFLKTIGDSAFEGCLGLANIMIPDSVTNIGCFAFAYCASLTIYCEAASQPTGWNEYWNPYNCPIVWGYKGE